MTADQLRALSHRLEQAAKAGGLTLLGDDLRAAARVVAAMVKLDGMGKDWRMVIDDCGDNALVSECTTTGYHTAIEAIEAAQ